MDIYLTHCSKEKDPSLRDTELTATPDVLYTNRGIRQFMQRCMEKEVHWAILSDNYGVIFSDEKRGWYAKPPDTVTPEEERAILTDFDNKLGSFDAIYFYVRTETYHPFYERVLKASSYSSKIRLIYRLDVIGD